MDLEDRIGLTRIDTKQPNASLFDIVFVHGLGGGSHSTWMNEDRVNAFWPLWIAKEFNGSSVWVLGFATSVSAWLEKSMPLADLGIQILEELHSHQIGTRPLVFIAHSMGGIVVKQLLNHSRSQGVPRWKKIADSTIGVAFISTPHFGASLASFADFARMILQTTEQVSELKYHDSRLREMHGTFLSYASERKLICRTFSERKEFKPETTFLGLNIRPPRGFIVVDATSSEPNIPGERSIPLDEDHISICKPKSTDSQIHRYICSFLRECVAMVAEPSPTVRDSHSPSTNLGE